ncbi:MAG TPA: cellulose biosynthesis protein BcsG [Gallionella sp.]
MSGLIDASKESGDAGEAVRPSYAEMALGIWSFYFIVKLALYGWGLIGFHSWVNLAFAVFILIPVRHVLWRRIKLLVTVLLAIALLYYDSWLPPIGRVLSQASLVSGFSAAYLFELAGRFVSLPVVAMLVATWGLYWFVSRWLRMDTVVILTMVAMPAMALFQDPKTSAVAPQQAAVEDDPDWYAHSAPSTVSIGQAENSQASLTQSEPTAGQAGTAGKEESDNPVLDMNKVLERFYTQESLRSVSFPTPKPGDLPFDVIFVHVCSLSWDDLQVTGLDKHPLWRRFDILLTRFNSASTYSGPAAIRIQRAACGQPTHTQLYSAVPAKCYLMDSLKRSGFEPNLVLNHDGHFDDFLKIIQRQGQFNVPPFPLEGALIAQHAFDDSPIYEDLSVLNRWLEHRQNSASPRIAAYYNTVSLHDGNHLAGPNAKLNSQENFKLRLTKLLDDLDQFMQDLEKSGRRTVVAMVPEHGAALRGDRMQIAGLREIPSPAITLVPVGIKVVGTQRSGDMLKVGKPTSYLAVSHIIARMLDKSPYKASSFMPADYIAELPVTPFVAQNEDVVMAGYKGRYYLRQDDSDWVDYTDF